MNNIKRLLGDCGIIKKVICMLWGVFLSLSQDENITIPALAEHVHKTGHPIEWTQTK